MSRDSTWVVNPCTKFELDRTNRSRDRTTTIFHWPPALSQFLRFGGKGGQISNFIFLVATSTTRTVPHVTTSMTGATHHTFQGLRHSVDWVDISTSLFQSCFWDWCKFRALDLLQSQEQLLSWRACTLLFLRHPPCWNKRGTARTTRHVMTRRRRACLNATSGIWAWPPNTCYVALRPSPFDLKFGSHNGTAWFANLPVWSSYVVALLKHTVI